MSKVSPGVVSIEHQVQCGVRREVAACLERVRIVGGDEAGCNEWPWQVLDDYDYLTWW